jgi:hypothetical protein
MSDADRASSYRGLRFLAAASLVAASLASAVAAEPELLPGKPSIWGVWIGTGGYPDIDPRFRSSPWPTLELTSWGAAESKRITTPETPDECAPYGPIAYMSAAGLFPLEIARTTTGAVMMYEPSPAPRRIYMDGRAHPDDLDPTWLGHAVGHWDGDTLVIDTVGVNGRSRPLNGYLSGAVNSTTDTTARLPVSDELHLIERIRLVGNGEYLEDEMTVTDLKAYTRAFTVKHYWQRRPDLDVLEYSCFDSRRPDAEGRKP